MVDAVLNNSTLDSCFIVILLSVAAQCIVTSLQVRKEVLSDVYMVCSELERSGLVKSLVDSAAASVQQFGASEVTLVLDGLARLRHQPSTTLLDALAQRVSSSHTPLHKSSELKALSVVSLSARSLSSR